MKLTNITPEQYRCPYADCPAIYTACGIAQCPTVIAIGDTYAIIGRRVACGPNDYSASDYLEIVNRIGDDETAVTIPAVIVNEAVNAELCRRIAELEAALVAMMNEHGALDGNPDTDSPAERMARAALSPDKATP
jgi:hypothetical protein